jgi:predicted secreted protein
MFGSLASHFAVFFIFWFVVFFSINALGLKDIAFDEILLLSMKVSAGCTFVMGLSIYFADDKG